MKKFKIQELAMEAKRQQQSLVDSDEQRLSLEREESELKLLEAFEETFRDELPLLQEAGIKVSAHWNHKRYWHMGTHIKFQLGEKELKMDFAGVNHYRYEHAWEGNKTARTMVYGSWDKGRFYIFIAEGLGLIES